MSEFGNSAEYVQNQPQVLDLRIEQRGFSLGNSIHVPSEMLGTNLWEEMIQKTQATGREFGTVVSAHDTNIHTSKIFEGLGESYDYDGNGKNSPSFSPPFLPHGLRSLHPRMKDLVLVHTHPIPNDVAHLPTTAMSATDIIAYANSTYNALVMIDKGGVHILTGRDPYREIGEADAHRIEAGALRVSEKNTNTIAEVRKEIAKKLVPFGIRYYFSPDKTPTTDGVISLDDSATEAIS